MNFLIILSFFFGSVDLSNHQDPVSWSFEIEKGTEYYTFIAKATMQKKWVLYSQENGDDGPVPTYFEYLSKDVTFQSDKTEEVGNMISNFDKMFETQVNKYKGEVVFKRTFIPKSESGTFKGNVEYMTCDGDKCLPPTIVDFNLTY